ncbi:MAG: tetratricopeptide repeat protein [Planctomycetaceae bacterium]|nr:tetratricopeptide repeat protein [Planctomycetaceae bacterium]
MKCPIPVFLTAILLSGLTFSAAPPALRQDTRFADPVSCIECHLTACNDWEKSDHRRSMDHATEESVLGDFSNVRFIHIGFDDLLDFTDETLKIFIDDIFYSPQSHWTMREYGQTERTVQREPTTVSPVFYDQPGWKFKPPLEPRFEDFALACFDAKTGIAEKLRQVMSEAQRKEFDEEVEYRTLLIVNRPSEIAGAQSRIVGRLQVLIEGGKIPHEAIPERCETFRMYRDGKKFMVETDVGPQETGIVEIRFTLGFRPLQQYLVETDGGRLQCLPIAWDSVDRRWFHLYPKEQIPREDPLHWTKPLQNWNFMCADCHTTGFEKNFDNRSLAYRSTFTEINVGCQSCHGPCGDHVETARRHNLITKWQDGIPMGTDILGRATSSQNVESCAACHTRRRVLRENISIRTPLEPLLDSIVPEMLDRTIYYPDGQLLDEAFEIGSFMQSKMYSRGVSCTNCHEPHSLRLRFTGNRLCAQCHAPDMYDTVRHHFHPDSSKPGTQCIECHFPQSTYMIADPRRDHSIRKPSPELTMLSGVPNACTQCHQDRTKGETLGWAHEHVERWYSELRGSAVGYSAAGPLAEHYSLAIAAGRRGDPRALPLLEAVIRDQTQRDHRDIVRASALTLFGRMATPQNATPAQLALIVDSLQDRSPLVRLAAVESFFRQPGETRLHHLTATLNDPLLAIRIESARALAEVSDRLQDEAKQTFELAAQEYIASQQAVNDQAASYLNLAVFEHDRESARRQQVETWYNAALRAGQTSPAEATGVRNDYLRRLTAKPLALYHQSLRIDPEFIPSRINLAMLHNERGEPKEAEEQFREVLRIDPEQGDTAYSLGLLLAELNRLNEAGEMLKRAAGLRPENARIRYNLALLLMQQEKRREALPELEAALKIEPTNIAFLHALAILYLQMDNRADAISTIDRLTELEPLNPQWRMLRQRAGASI